MSHYFDKMAPIKDYLAEQSVQKLIVPTTSGCPFSLTAAMLWVLILCRFQFKVKFGGLYREISFKANFSPDRYGEMIK